ncbi:hypothetical protein HaLaN_14691 [Haematococcus lacustris]|uniref:Uncharacterized protein n=1 Tax=Haematococcus lacustris TaxID=44745 RepID=A0A699Z5Y4_HAELA|nr:hypothetical protein HaLaN_14691 [Haematococcus lacustris]
MSPRSVRMGAIAALVVLAVTWPIAQGRLQDLGEFDSPAAADAHPQSIASKDHLASRQAATKGSTHAVPSSIDDREAVTVKQAGAKSKEGRTLLGDSYAPAHAPAHPSKGSNQASANAAAHASSSGDGKSKASAKAKADSKSKGGRLLLTDLSGSTAPAYTPAHPSKGSNQASANAAAHASSSGDGKSKASAKAKADSKSKGGRLLLADKPDSPASA